MPKNQWAKLLIELVNLNIEFYMYIDKTSYKNTGCIWISRSDVSLCWEKSSKNATRLFFFKKAATLKDVTCKKLHKRSLILVEFLN